MFYDVLKQKPAERRQLWGEKGCEDCEMARRAIKFVNLYLHKCLKNIYIYPAFVGVIEGHLIRAVLCVGDGYVWLETLHRQSIVAFMRDVWRIVKEAVGIRSAFLADGVPSVYHLTQGYIYQFQFHSDKIGVDIVEAQQGLVYRIEGFEETIEFLVNFLVMLKTIEEVNF